MDSLKKMLWIFSKSLRFCFWPIIFSVLFLITSSLLSLIVNIINKDIINVLEKSQQLGVLDSLFVGLLLAYLTIYFFQYSAKFLHTLIDNNFKFSIDELFHKMFMWKAYNTSQTDFLNSEFQNKYYFVGGKTNEISTYLNSILRLVFSNFTALIGTMVLFVIYEPWLIIFSVLIFFCTLLTNRYIVNKEYELDKTQIQEKRFSDYYKYLLTAKDCAKELRIYQTKIHIYKKWVEFYEKLSLEQLNLSIEKVKIYSIATYFRLFLRIISTTLLLIGVYLNRYDVGTFTMLIGLIGSSVHILNNLSHNIIVGSYKSLKYISDYFDFITPITDDEIANLTKQTASATSLAFGPFEELKAEHISFSYPNSKNKAIDDISLTIKKGEIVSILGYNGSGKTTLSKLLNGSYIPQTGKVSINGNPITTENKTDVFSYWGIAPQEFSKFSLPIKELIGLRKFAQQENAQSLGEAYRKANIFTILDKLPNGENTILGKEYDEDGVDLSGGEWQKMILASSFMGSPEILLMDEPTASIDPLEELELLDHLRENLNNKTAILISHRIGFARLADRIIMLQNGKIVEQGTHTELIEKNGYYSLLFHEQQKLYEE
mgnify:CR=1 FL=1